MKTASKFSLVLVLAGLTAAGISNIGQATQTSLPAAENHRLDRLAGAWSATGTIQGQPSFPGLITFSVDGSVQASATPMGAVAPYETPAYGNWVATGHNQAAYTFVALFANPDGSLSATTKTVGKLRYDSRADTWSGPFKFFVLDPEGNEIVSYPGMIIDAKRIAVETLD
jgi:hypothetical protein